MAHQDYVSRSNSAKKKNNPYKKSQAEQPPILPTKVKLLAVFLLIGLLGFGYFLWSIKDIETEPVAQNKSIASKSKETSELPRPPKEKWQYMEELKTKEVEVGEYTVNEKGPWKMQCGSFKTHKQAEVMRATIAFAGLSAKVSSVKGSSGTWHKVYLGPYEKKRMAEKDKHKIKSRGVTTCQIWLWN